MASEYPEKGELVLGTVNSIFNQGAFIDLDEYPSKRGMLHLTEISLKWVRNIRDYVKENQKVVLLVLRIDNQKGHIDLSLRRVTDSQRKTKLQVIKQRQRSEKLIELLCKEMSCDAKSTMDAVISGLDDYDSIYEGLEAISSNNNLIKNIELEPPIKKKLLELIINSIKPPEVEVIGYVEMKSHKSDGVNAIRKALEEIKKHKPNDVELEVSYISAPMYRVKVKAGDYKHAEKALRKSVESGIKYIESKKGSAVFHRELETK